MRIALISPTGGHSVAWLASALAPRAEVHLMVPAAKARYMRPDLDDRVQVETYRLSRFYRPLRQARDWLRLLGRVRELDPDVVHLQQGHPLLNVLLWRLRGFPLVLTVHEATERGRPLHGPRRRPQRLLDIAFRRADALIVHGETVRSQVAGRGIDPSSIHVFARAAPHAAPAAGDEEFPTILFFGRIWPYKGLADLIRAEPLVAKAVPGLRTVIAGRGEDFRPYRELMTHPDRFETINRFVSRSERNELFARASVVVLPYVDASTSAVIPIAYQHGKPVVATSVGGLPEEVDDGRTGLLVPPRNHVALAAALVRILRDDSLRRELGRGGLEKLRTESAPDGIARKTLDVYALAARALRESTV
jgi:glycosyltransferase involved in cell wall biosynthesis